MHLLLLAATWTVAVGPAVAPAVDPTDVAGGETIGVVWHDQATVAPALQQRLVDELAMRAGLPRQAVIEDASALARARVTLSLPRASLEKVAGWRSMLDEASAAYREGQLPAARSAVDGLLETVLAAPTVPGAATLAWQAHVLRAQLSWAEGDAEGFERALAAAVALDPETTPSTRQVPPPVVEAYARQQAAVLAEASRWPSLQISGGSQGPLAVEIDGVPGRRPVPPGDHLVVVRRPGHAPVGAVVSTDAPWVVPEDASVLDPGLPTDREMAERLCDFSGADWLLLARLRDDRLGVQRYACGQGFGAAWYEERDGWTPGIDHVLATGGFEATAVLHDDEPWPAVAPPPRARSIVLSSSSFVSPRDRLRRAVPWLLIGGVIAGAVTVGVVVGGEPRPDLSIDGKGFLRP
ncbi:hypothetical protein [Paraliomyxa miuraensis]|uniref:hypothetical protein n=1 Tax=Paraliomyxa miuraensis TaxID=376150 RepID=UPI00224DAE0C|nr:hypothetical protein [Paraliomyxa miuraensis]MCX4244646.1 hypothetical protein [Paraliomyxa miuraensis]